MPTDNEIQTKTEAFAQDLADLVRRAALEAVTAALGGGAPVDAAKAAKAAPASKALVSRKPAAAKRAPGAKRPAAELAQLTEELGEYIAAHPGVRMGAISKALATPAKDLRFPVVKLVRAKRVRTEGQKQNTAYFPV